MFKELLFTRRLHCIRFKFNLICITLLGFNNYIVTGAHHSDGMTNLRYLRTVSSFSVQLSVCLFGWAYIVEIRENVKSDRTRQSASTVVVQHLFLCSSSVVSSEVAMVVMSVVLLLHNAI